MTFEKIEISLRATKLNNHAGMFKGISDPFAVVTLLPNSRGASPKILGKTEVAKNSLSPDWTKTFFVDYELGTPVSILVKIFDHVRKGDNIEMGSGVFEMGAVLGAKGNTKAKEMKKGGTLFVRAQKAIGTGLLHLKLSGITLTNTEGFMKKSDPFYEFTRKEIGPRGTEWNVVHRSHKVDNSLNPTWKEETIDLSTLCRGDLNLPLRLSIYDYESNGKHVPMGIIETSVNKLIQAKSSRLKVINNGKNAGTIAVHIARILDLEGHEEKGSGTTSRSAPIQSSAPVPSAPAMPSAPQPTAPQFSVPMPSAPMPSAPQPYAPSYSAPQPTVPVFPSAAYGAPTPTPSPSQPTFLDYVNGGCEFQLCVAIDFTGSNGDPRKPGTLHYLAPDGSINDYEKAICSIGGILADYDSDKKFPVWGFGAKYSGQVYHLFQCGQDAEVEGVDGIINAYRKTFQSGLIMSSPTVITEVITTAAAFAKSGQESANKEGKQNYTTLLILTDGAVSDVRATVQCLKTCSDAPLSIVIVGIGSADFSAMQFLDDSARDFPDVVQFVEYNRHKHDFNSLTAATLHELPDQLVAYFQRNGIDPLPPVQVEEEEIVVGAAEEEIDLTIDFGDDEGDIAVGGGSGMYVPPPKFGQY